MKIIFRGETKRVPDFQQYDELVRHASKIFGLEARQLGEALKVFYMDEDGDIISITSQSDLEEAYQVSQTKFRVALSQTIEEAREALVGGINAANDALDRSSMLNQSYSSLAGGSARGYGQLGGVGPAAHSELENLLQASARSSMRESALQRNSGLPPVAMNRIGAFAEPANPFGGQASARMTDYELQLQSQIELMRKQIELQNLQNQMRAMRDRANSGTSFLTDFEQVEPISNNDFARRPTDIIQQNNDRIQAQAFAQVQASADIQAMSAQTDIKMSEQASVACGSDVVHREKVMSAAGTDAKDMVDELNRRKVAQNSFGCNTEGVKTAHTGVGATVKTGEAGSQCQKAKLADGACNTQIQTDSQGCQKDTIGTEKQVSCDLLSPETSFDASNLPVCYKCDGKKVNKKGKTCRKCMGQGRINMKFLQEIHSMIADEVKAHLQTELQKSQLSASMSQSVVAEKPKAVHERYTCDRCGVNPIVGIRYHCSVRPDYDLCEKCEAASEAPHPMIKIREPKHAPQAIVCEYQAPQVQVQAPVFPVRVPVPEPVQRIVNTNPKAKLVGQPAGEIVQDIGQKFTLAWTFENVGEAAWPLDVLFLRANGDEIESSTWVADRGVGINDKITVLVEFTAPQKPGIYFACYRLVQGNNNRFGDKVFLNLTVKDKAAEKKETLLVAEAEPEQIMAKPEKTQMTEEEAAMLRSQNMVEGVDKFAEGEDLDNSIVIEDDEGSGDAGDKLDGSPPEDNQLGSALIDDVEPAQTVQTGDKPFESNILIQEMPKTTTVLAESLKIQESNGPSALAATNTTKGQGPAAADPCGDDSMVAALLQSEFNKADNIPQQPQRPVVSPPEPVPVLEQSAQASMDVQKVAYLEKMNTAHYPRDLKDNLSALMSMGFLDFARNLRLLQQNHNNLEPVLGKLIDNN